MFCTNCGNKMSDGKFCSNCGKVVEGSEQPGQQHSAAAAVIKPKKNKIKPKLGIIALALVVILAFGFIAKDYVVYAISPELSVKLAAKKTMDNIMKDYSKMQSFLFGNIDTSKNHSANMNLSIEEASHTDEWVNQDLYLLNGMGVDITSIYDDVNKELFLDGKYQIAGQDLISLMFKLDDNELQISIPELFDSLISFPSKSFGEEWNKSTLAQESGQIINDNLDLSLSNLQKNNNIEEIDDKTKNAYMNAFKLILEDAIYEKDGTTTLRVGTSDKKVNKTIVTIQEENVKEGIIAFLEAVKYDNRIKYWIDNLNQDFNSNELNDGIEEMQDFVKEDFHMDGLTINIYTNNGNLVRSEIELVADKDSEDGTLFCNIDLVGEKSLIDDVKFELEVGDEKIIFESKGNHTGNNSIFLDDTKLRIISYYGEEFIGECSTEIDLKKKNDNFKSNISLSIDGEEMNLETLGDFNSSAKSLGFKSEDINFTYRDYNDDILEMVFNIDLKTGTDIANKPKFIDYDKVELFKMEEYELYEFMYSIEDNIYQLEEKIQENLGY